MYTYIGGLERVWLWPNDTRPSEIEVRRWHQWNSIWVPITPMAWRPRYLYIFRRLPVIGYLLSPSMAVPFALSFSFSYSLRCAGSHKLIFGAPRLIDRALSFHVFISAVNANRKFECVHIFRHGNTKPARHRGATRHGLGRAFSSSYVRWKILMIKRVAIRRDKVLAQHTKCASSFVSYHVDCCVWHFWHKPEPNKDVRSIDAGV